MAFLTQGVGAILKRGIVIAAYSACFSEYLPISTEHAAIWLIVKGKFDIDIRALQFAGMSAVHDAVKVAIGLGQNFNFCTILPQLQWRILLHTNYSRL